MTPQRGEPYPLKGGWWAWILESPRGAGPTTTSAPTGISIALRPGTSTTTRGAGDRPIAGDSVQRELGGAAGRSGFDGRMPGG